MITLTQHLTVLAHNGIYRAGQRLRDESGQTAAEYMGVIVVVAGILAGIAATGIGGNLTTSIKNGITDVFQKAGGGK